MTTRRPSCSCSQTLSCIPSATRSGVRKSFQSASARSRPMKSSSRAPISCSGVALWNRHAASLTVTKRRSESKTQTMSIVASRIAWRSAVCTPAPVSLAPGEASGGEQGVHVGVAAGLRAVGPAQLAIGVREVELDRLLGDPQLAGDPGVGVALRDQPEDLKLALGQRAVRRRRARLGAGAMDDRLAGD